MPKDWHVNSNIIQVEEASLMQVLWAMEIFAKVDYDPFGNKDGS